MRKNGRAALLVRATDAEQAAAHARAELTRVNAMLDQAYDELGRLRRQQELATVGDVDLRALAFFDAGLSEGLAETSEVRTAARTVLAGFGLFGRVSAYDMAALERAVNGGDDV